MILDNKRNFDFNYLCIRTLVIQNDGEYGYHVYAKHGYHDFEVSFYISSENLIDIINELNYLLRKGETK